MTTGLRPTASNQVGMEENDKGDGGHSVEIEAAIAHCYKSALGSVFAHALLPSQYPNVSTINWTPV